jgi:linoleoyl-CoA desaturase
MNSHIIKYISTSIFIFGLPIPYYISTWIFVTDYRKYFSGKIGSIALRKMTSKEHFYFWFYKAAHALIFVVIPIYMVGFTPWIIGFLSMGMVTGFVLSIVFQLAHTVEHTHFPLPDACHRKNGR